MVVTTSERDLTPFLAEQREVNERLTEIGRTMPPPAEVPVERVRRNRIEGGGGLPRPARVEAAVNRSIRVGTGDLVTRVFVPDTVDAVYLHVHGGGWVFGSIWEQDLMLWSIARHAGVAVVSVGYRLAPEHPFPQPVEDVDAALGWLIAHAESEFGTDRLLVGGESAGAHLAVSALLRLRDRGIDVPSRVVGAQLSYGIYDLGMTESQRTWGDRFLVLSTPYLSWLYDVFLPDVPADRRRDPRYSPLYADVAGLPPALFTIGTLDPLLDDSLLMAERWSAAGNITELAVYPEAPHGFNAMPTEMGRAGGATIIEFLRRCAQPS